MRYGLLSTAAFAALSLSVATGLAQTSPSGGAAGSTTGGSSMTTVPPSSSGTTMQHPAGAATHSTTMPGSTTGSVSAPSLTTEQQTTLRESIGSARVRPMPHVNFSVSSGTVIPANAHVQLHALPPTLIRVVPAYRTYRYFVVGDQIVIVEPSSRRIVEVITRAG